MNGNPIDNPGSARFLPRARDHFDMFGGGGLNPRKLQQMMEQMGIDVDDIDATEVVIKTADGEALVFDSPEVTRMDAQGQRTYQIVGEPEEKSIESASSVAAIPADDIALVSDQAGVDEAAAQEALEATDGDLAAAIDRLS